MKQLALGRRRAPYALTGDVMAAAVAISERTSVPVAYVLEVLQDLDSWVCNLVRERT